MRSGLQVFISGLLLALSLQVQAVTVVTSIPPLAAIVQPLLDEDDELVVLLTPGASPHGFQLKPSDMRALERADLVVSVGTGVDSWLKRALTDFKGSQVVMAQQPGLVILSKREGGVWSAHSHSHGEVKNPLRMDGHLWLSLDNARLTLHAASEMLQVLNPRFAGAYAAREREILASLAERYQAWEKDLTPHREQGFVVMHDAYQYFEAQFGLNGVGAIHVNPEVAPSIKRLQELRQSIVDRNVRCVFTEPQFPQSRLRPVVDGLEVDIGTLDPLGVDNEIRPYEAFYDRLVQDFVACME